MIANIIMNGLPVVGFIICYGLLLYALWRQQ